jgi:protein-tyrosine phosphatase
LNWIRDNYGSRSGIFKALALRAGWYFHPLSGRHIDLSRVRRLVFVCRGNICRSPLGQRVAEDAGFPAISYGFDTTPGKPADAQMQSAAGRLGHDLSAHRTSRMTDYREQTGDLILLFEPGHLVELDDLGSPAGVVALLGSWASPRHPYIHDPYGSSPAYYSRSAAIIRQSVLNLVATIGRAHAD